MTPNLRAYFDNTVLPLLDREHPEVAGEMSLRVEGSLGFGLEDELSDVDVTLFLPEQLWRARGGQVQLTLLNKLEPLVGQPYSQYPGSRLPRDPRAWWRLGHSEISVHRLSELLAGQAEDVLAGERDAPWEEVPLEELLQLQIHPILRDGRGALTRLRELTAPGRYPEPLWAKALLREFLDLAGEYEEFRKAVLPGKPLEAQLFLAEVVRMSFRAIFLANRRYYPWRGGFLRLFGELPFGPRELSGEFGTLASSAAWPEKLAAVDRIVRVLTDQVLSHGLLTADMLRYPLAAWAERAWENPGWLGGVDEYAARAEAAGYEPRNGWIWEQWGWPEGRVP